MLRFLWKESIIAIAAATMALASLGVSVFLSHGLQNRILHVQETTNLRRQLFLLTNSLREAEAAQRNYIITGDSAHAAPLHAVMAALPDRWTSVKSAARNEHTLAINLDALESQTMNAMRALEQTAEMRQKQGREAAIAQVEAGTTQEQLIAVHERLSVMMESLEQMLQEQSRDMMQAERMGHTASVSAGAVALLLGGLSLWQWRRSLGHFRRQLELKAEKARAEQMARDKGDFLAAMSHEVRTPLNAVMGLSEQLRETLPPGTAKDQAAAVHKAGAGMLRLVNDLLDLSRMDAGRLKLQREAVSVADFASSVDMLLRPQAQAAGVAFEVTLDPSVPSHLLADEGRLRQILLNLAGNALKFTPPDGRVSVRLESESTAAGTMLVIEVKDTGCGISPELQHAVFRPYVQGQAQQETPQGGKGGIGLGLAIVRQLVRLMDGAISLQSQADTGSTFRVTLPLIVPRLEWRGTPELNAPTAKTDNGSPRSEAAPPLRKEAAQKLWEIMAGTYAAAHATQSTEDVAALAAALETLGEAERSDFLIQTASELRRASASFAVTALTHALDALPQRLAPLTVAVK